MILEQKLNQSLKLSQSMKMSLNILEMSMLNLNNFIKNEFSNKFGVEVNYSKQETYNDDDRLEFSFPNEEENFFQILEGQLSYFNISKKIKDICIFIINNLNAKGYLEISKVEIKDILSTSDRELEEAFNIIHNLEPYGVGAYSLEECLKIQLEKKKIIDKKLNLLIDNFLYPLSDKKYDLIKEKLNIDETTLTKYIDIIKSLNPIPSRGYNTGKIRKIIPDIFVKQINNEITYEINQDLIPQINIKNNINDKEYKRLNEIIHCIEKRFNTLDKIIKIVLREQKDFFITEGKKMNVLKISELASELDLSSSTISRAIKEKYIKSDFGIISLRKLFNLSSTIFLCQKKIAEYIENEDRKKPYSDQDIVKLLENDGIKIARRTVSKYRIDLGYKSSSERKRSF
ncbi:RNA polymerase factor sigma-54 [Fusobacterium periodonticum]|uniref:RNA polymerase sigma-54 factor n=1 Tax=Fusobacterium periodonticum ATCC 33693 TaxID=546275 RepID=D4CW93_9FUSO|nr:RNA polymerase factor sigma-54 [Fusobacterium periodonticum]EFE86387.1 RNA polymerase sigma-54 factor [Fusobacterium periodonticum ATCC 33693]